MHLSTIEIAEYNFLKIRVYNLAVNQRKWKARSTCESVLDKNYH